MKLYKINNGIGTYWVVAEHPTEAEAKLKTMLDAADYGFSEKRKALSIEIIAEHFVDKDCPTGKKLIL